MPIFTFFPHALLGDSVMSVSVQCRVQEQGRRVVGLLPALGCAGKACAQNDGTADQQPTV
jgi:hypothetical protein